jgi:hypothetical protein
MNNEEKLNNIINRAMKLGSFFLTLTLRDKSRTEGDLTHFTYREDFPNDDIIPSLDHCVRALGIKPPVSDNVIIKPKEIDESVERKPLKIAILTHFNRCPDSYSPGKAVKNQIKMLMRYGHEVVFFTQEKSYLTKDVVGCEVRTVIPKFRREKGVVNEDAKKRFVDVLREQLTSDFDLAITHDFYIDDCITYREAIRECNVPIKWLHWARSGVGKQIDFSMPNARYVYMNYADSEIFASRINVSHDLVRIVFNEKDPRILFKWNKITELVSDKLRLQDKDIIQTYPVCTTRLDSKGIDSVIRVFGMLKFLGNKVALIICNSNGKRRKEEIAAKLAFAKDCGLDENDILFTSTLTGKEIDTETEVPHEVVVQLMQLSNLFIFPTLAEVCPNILLEASMNKNLIVVNEDLPLLYDFVDKAAVLSYPFTSSQSLHYSGKDDGSVEKLAKQIIGQLKSNKQDIQFRKVWKTHTMDNVYNTQLKNILYE